MLGSARSLAIVLTLSALPSIELESCCELSVQAIAELQQSSSASGAEDAMVLRAVIEHTIIPEAAKVNSGRNRAAIVLLEDHSGPLCIGKTVSSGPCRIPEQWQQFLQPNLSRGWRGMISSDQRRRELVASFEARNAVPHALPAINHPAVVMIAVDRLERPYAPTLNAQAASRHSPYLVTTRMGLRHSCPVPTTVAISAVLVGCLCSRRATPIGKWNLRL